MELKVNGQWLKERLTELITGFLKAYAKIPTD